MATTYSSSKVASTVQSRGGLDITSAFATYEAAVALVIDDVIRAVKIPAGATIQEIILAVDDLDTGSTLTLDVGDGTTADRFIAASTIGQGGGVVRLGQGVTGAAAAGCANYTYTAEDTIDIKVKAAPAGGGTGTLNLTVFYTMQS
jgi:hypothetical protein